MKLGDLVRIKDDDETRLLGDLVPQPPPFHIPASDLGIVIGVESGYYTNKPGNSTLHQSRVHIMWCAPVHEPFSTSTFSYEPESVLIRVFV